MPSLHPDYSYDIFISYRHNDNRSGWVTDFVNALQEELAATIKEPLSIYFDKNPHDGLLETHSVDKSLEGKLKCLIFIPILSQTYCDPKSFAWQHEFCAFIKLANGDQFGRNIKLSSGNVSSRILPIKIHELDMADRAMIESETGDILRSIDFIYKEAGVNRPLRSHEENPGRNQNQTIFRNQVNKVANSVKSLLAAMTHQELRPEPASRPALEPAVKTSSPASRFSLIPTIVITAAVSVVLTWLLARQQKDAIGASDKSTVLRASILPPAGSRIELIGEGSVGVGRRSISLSAKGDRFAFIGSYQGRPHIFIRDLNSFQTRVLAQTTGAYGCTLSPGGEEVAYFVGNKVLKININGDSPTLIAEATNPMDIAWTSDSELYFSAGEGSTLFRAGQKVEMVSHGSFTTLGFIPGTRSLIACSRFESDEIGIFDTQTNQIQRLELKGRSAKFVPPNRILCMQGSTLEAYSFDPETNKVDLKKLYSVPNIRGEAYGTGQYDVSENGSLVYIEGKDARVGNLVMVGRDGTLDTLSKSEEEYRAFKLSPDASKLAVPIHSASEDLWILDLKTSRRNRITNTGKAGNPVWVNNDVLIYRQDSTVYLADLGKGSAQVLLKSASPNSISADGSRLVVQKGANFSIYDLKTKTLTAITDARPGTFHHGSISPNGQLFAYTYNDTKAFHVYLKHAELGGKTTQVSTLEGSEEPRWTSDGKRIIYRTGQQWYEVTVLNAETLEVSQPKLVLEGDYYNISGFSYDITGDGQKLVLVKTPTEKTASEIRLVSGWMEEVGNRQ